MGLQSCSVHFTSLDDCSIEVPEDTNMIPPGIKGAAYGLFGLNVLVIFVWATWLYLKRETPQVQVSEPSFLLLVLLGCLISSSTIIALAQEDEGDGAVPACMAIPWLYSAGFSVTFGTLFARIHRVYKVFTHQYVLPMLTSSVRSSQTSSSTTLRHQRPQPVNVKDTLLSIGAVLFLDVIILILWTFIDPLEWKRSVVRMDQFGHPLETSGTCHCESWKIFVSLIVVLHVGLLAVACYMCYAARFIPTKYSEHRYVSISMISNLQIFIVGGKQSVLI